MWLISFERISYFFNDYLYLPFIFISSFSVIYLFIVNTFFKVKFYIPYFSENNDNNHNNNSNNNKNFVNKRDKSIYNSKYYNNQTNNNHNKNKSHTNSLFKSSISNENNNNNKHTVQNHNQYIQNLKKKNNDNNKKHINDLSEINKYLDKLKNEDEDRDHNSRRQKKKKNTIFADLLTSSGSSFGGSSDTNSSAEIDEVHDRVIGDEIDDETFANFYRMKNATGNSHSFVPKTNNQQQGKSSPTTYNNGNSAHNGNGNRVSSPTPKPTSATNNNSSNRTVNTPSPINLKNTNISAHTSSNNISSVSNTNHDNNNTIPNIIQSNLNKGKKYNISFEQLSNIAPEKQQQFDTVDVRVKSPTSEDINDTIESLSSSRGMSSPSTMRKTVILNEEIIYLFWNRSIHNTIKGIETGALLLGKDEKTHFIITELLFPNQIGRDDSFDCVNDEQVFSYQLDRNLITLGWIHTHPTQTVFLSSVDIHNQYAYQTQLKETIAIVVSPKPTPNYDIFSIRADGMDVIGRCKQRGFHPHENPERIYSSAKHVKVIKNDSINNNFINNNNNNNNNVDNQPQQQSESLIVTVKDFRSSSYLNSYNDLTSIQFTRTSNL